MSLSPRPTQPQQQPTGWAAPAMAPPGWAPPYGMPPGYPMPQGYPGAPTYPIPPYGMPYGGAPGYGMPYGWPMMMGAPQQQPPPPPAGADPQQQAMWKMQMDLWKMQSDQQSQWMTRMMGQQTMGQGPTFDQVLGYAERIAELRGGGREEGSRVSILKPDGDTTLIVQDGQIDTATGRIMAKDMVKGIANAVRTRGAAGLSGGATSPRAKVPPNGGGAPS